MRTHLAIGAAIALVFVPHVNHNILFIPIVLLASLLPDIDSGFSYLGKRGWFRPVQFFTRHRGMLHSLTLAFIISLIFAFYLPAIALPFFLGYSFHLLADSFTVDGVSFFWPYMALSAGKIRTGGKVEDGIFLSFLLIDIALFLLLFVK